MPRLVDDYYYAYSDFSGSGTPCIFKSGPDWPLSDGPTFPRLTREARPVHQHPIQSTWLSIGKNIYQEFDTIGVNWTSINPLAYANAGEAKPFCSLVPSLSYHAAVTAADVVKKILAKAGFPAIEVAFVESVVTRSVAAGPKLLSFHPFYNKIPDLRKPFTPILGLSIAPLKYPHFEGTAALHFRLDKDDQRMTRENENQPREEFVTLGEMGYNKAIKAMTDSVNYHLYTISGWKDSLGRLGKPVDGEKGWVTERRENLLEEVERATKKVEQVNVLHDEVMKRYPTPDQRILGFVLHPEKIEVDVEPLNFTKDWALIELYDEKIDWSAFNGNMVYVGATDDPSSIGNFSRTLFPEHVHDESSHFPLGGLLQASGVVQDDEIRNPQHLDKHGERCLLVVKNGLTTGTTLGRVNGLESLTRIFDADGTERTSIEIAVLPCDVKRGKFSDAGDSGSVVLTRDGGIVGILTGGAGPTDEIDISYITPYWWIEQQIKAKYPGCILYEAVEYDIRTS